MPLRYLINDDGKPFDGGELRILESMLSALPIHKREAFRNENAAAIAKRRHARMLVVSGPGTGKSTLFKQRIRHWLESDPSARILALSFVRKLVADLDNDIQTDHAVSDVQKRQTSVHTLHKYARSVVEKTHGTAEFPLRAHFKIIGQSWKSIVWEDVLIQAGEADSDHYTWRNFEFQLHTCEFDPSGSWPRLKEVYFELCGFYNAVGFADLILRAIGVLKENPSLIEHDYFIIDEYQDFNPAEEALIIELTGTRKGLLIVGDDDQILYEKLKSGKAELIRALYQDTSFANAVLPFCSRCDFHIVKAADYFIKQDGDQGCIPKIYLPLKTDQSSPKISIVACAAPGTAVDYIAAFVARHKSELEERQHKLASGDEKDAYLLILSPTRGLKFYGSKDGKGADKTLLELVRLFATEQAKFSEDYFRLLSYYSLAKDPRNNFSFRKVLHYEGISAATVASLLSQCLCERKDFSRLNEPSIRAALEKATAVKEILDSSYSIREKVARLSTLLSIGDRKRLAAEIGKANIGQEQVVALEHQEEEDAELEELQIRQMSAIEMMTIVGSKGLSADHVMIIGFDDINMSHITRNAFYVAMTRARQTLHIITALKSGGAKRCHDFLDQLPEEHLQFCKHRKTDRQPTTFRNRTNFEQYLEKLSWAANNRPRAI